MSALNDIGSYVLLFALIFGMSATVDASNLRAQLRNIKAILTGIFLQFVVLPFLGFAVVKALDLTPAEGITLLVVTSSPGGSYSNWWCSIFNADLALSVTMTAISTLISVVMLPANLILYSKNTYDGDVVKNVNWVSIFVSLAIVISAIGLGLICSATIKSRKFNIIANKCGSLAGLALIIYSIVVSNGDNDDGNEGGGSSLWSRTWEFYCGVSTPCILGLALSNLLSTSCKLKEPERVTVSVECCYQNTGIATSVALVMFKGSEQADAVGVPLFYGLVEALVLGVYCILAWKIGWTKAPADESFCVVIGTSYEVEKEQLQDINAIEVVLGSPKSGLPDDLVFEIDSHTEPDDENAIYAISYPASERRPHNIAKQEYQGRVSFPVTSTPKADLDLTGIQIETPINSKPTYDRNESHDLEAPSRKHTSSTEFSDIMQASHHSNTSVPAPSPISGSNIKTATIHPEKASGDNPPLNSTNPSLQKSDVVCEDGSRI